MKDNAAPNKAFFIFAHGTAESATDEGKKRGIIKQFANYFREKKYETLELDGPRGIRDVQAIENNITTATEAISQWLKTADCDESGKYVIKLTGFSRGAVTCRRITNRLEKILIANEQRAQRIAELQQIKNNKQTIQQFIDQCKKKLTSDNSPSDENHLFDEYFGQTTAQQKKLKAEIAYYEQLISDSKSKQVSIDQLIQNETQKLIKDKNNKLITRDSVRVSLFEIDPVAGMGDKGSKETLILPGVTEQSLEEVRTIPSIVEQQIVILQVHERRHEFKPQDLTRTEIADPQKTTSIFLPLFGHHKTSTKVSYLSMKSAAIIVWDLLFKTLIEEDTRKDSTDDTMPLLWGIDRNIANSKKPTYLEYADTEPLTNEELLEQFAEMKNRHQQFEKLGRRFRVTDRLLPKKQRKFISSPEDYCPDRFFINRFERELLKKTYPKTFNYLFERGLYDPADPANTGCLGDKQRKS